MCEQRDTKPQSLGKVWRQGADFLRQAGVEEADADAELLLLYLLGISKTELLRDLREPFPHSKQDAWNEMLERRKAGEPVQYIVGQHYFYGRPFEVSPAVLIPRPETELLAEAVLEAGDRLWPQGEPLLLDVGTGSGILAVTFAAERPSWQVIASDLSADALQMARLNARRNGAADRLSFVQGDLLTPFTAALDGKPIDILVSNPPYIRSSDIRGLQREVRDHEPRLALDGGEDGLNPYRIMASQLRLLPRLPRLVAWEVGAGQARQVADFLQSAADWAEVKFVIDYAGIERHVLAIR